jgi:hypothetical protein
MIIVFVEFFIKIIQNVMIGSVRISMVMVVCESFESQMALFIFLHHAQL